MKIHCTQSASQGVLWWAVVGDAGAITMSVALNKTIYGGERHYQATPTAISYHSRFPMESSIGEPQPCGFIGQPCHRDITYLGATDLMFNAFGTENKNPNGTIWADLIERYRDMQKRQLTHA